MIFGVTLYDRRRRRPEAAQVLPITINVKPVYSVFILSIISLGNIINMYSEALMAKPKSCSKQTNDAVEVPRKLFCDDDGNEHL